ncbi:MAG: flagellar hook assembly protein FlgD, partial [Mariprofundaceae bacterium]
MLTPTIDQAAAQHAAPPTKQQDLGRKDIFLKLLVAQMQFQDPLKPQDATQMSSQLAQFNMVEQQTNTNRLLEQMLAGASRSASPAPAGAAGWLGRTASYRSDTIQWQGTPVPTHIELPSDAAQVRVQVLDAQGAPVRTIALGPQSAGHLPFTWDGMTDSGATATNGNYRIRVDALDTQGHAL